MIDRACERCGKEFQTYPSRIEYGHGRFCSRTCSNRQHTWKGDSAGIGAGWVRAQTLVKVLGKCQLCPAPAVDRHHVDGNTLNNDLSNIMRLCRSCHMRLDKRHKKAWETRREAESVADQMEDR